MNGRIRLLFVALVLAAMTPLHRTPAANPPSETMPAECSLADYFRANFHVTTSGHFSTPAMLDAMAELGADRVMFSVDYPFEDFGEAAEWFDRAEIGEADRLKIGRTNAMTLFKLKGA
jgi:2,3-dihydroxybenzoate decarboxylase